MQPEWVSFARAKADTDHVRRHILLGNGFSTAVHSGFSYHSLYGVARMIEPRLDRLFEGHGTDFERAIAGTATSEDQAAIRSAFIRAVTRVHPKRGGVTEHQIEACGLFLGDFAGRLRGEVRGSIFSTNYDLLLYWVLMQRKDQLKVYDGFDLYGEWDSTRLHNSYVFYLHGALHLYVARVPRKKYRKLMWKEDASIIPQVRENLEAGRFPLFVSEGTSLAKTHQIGSHLYLRSVSQRLERACSDPDSAVFTLGHSLADVDDHITDMLGAANGPVYLGLFSDRDERRALELTAIWQDRRGLQPKPPLEVKFFHSTDCPAWGAAPATSRQGPAEAPARPHEEPRQAMAVEAQQPPPTARRSSTGPTPPAG